ncbi:MAG TPA: LptF/LptG family permease, partial [Deltaproteobacteria bacterium]|nr:LptF/LptG family permease [Deltaproteobacteria bacterium]
IVAMRASGVRGPKLFAPVVALALACAVVHLAVTTTLGPLAAGKIRDRLVESAPRKILAFFEEREFSDRFKNVVMYVEAVNQRKRQIKGIFLETSSPAQVVVSAEKGTVDVDGTQVTLRLFKGSIFTQTDRADRYLTFGEYSFMLDADVVSLMRIKSYETATQGEFRRLISENPTPKRIREYHARYAFPVLNLLLAAIGIAFGVQNPRSPRYTGFLVGMATVMGYYLVNVMGARLTNAHAISPVWGAWLPDAAFTAFLVATASARMSLRAAKRRRALPRAR